MVGSSILRNAPAHHQIFTVNREDLNLENSTEVELYFKKYNIEAVILAAAKVGGIQANIDNQYEFLLKNLQIQNSVINAAIQAEVKNLVFLGSSCAYPRLASQPISEGQLLEGSLESTNLGYALAKISGILLSRFAAQNYGYNYFTLMPTNLFGPNDNFDRVNSHVVAALMRKFHEAKLTGLADVQVWGTGKPLREFMHVDDLASASYFFLERNVKSELINIGTGEELSIEKLASLMGDVVGYEGFVKFDKSKPDGTPRKLLDVSKAKSFGWEARIDLVSGLEQTYRWFLPAYERGEIRGF